MDFCTAQIQLWYRLCLAILLLFGSLFAMHLGYSLTLGKRTAKLEKKNGKELEELEKLKTEFQQFKKQLHENLSPLPEKKNPI